MKYSVFFIALILITALTNNLAAYEPPYDLVEDAIQKGEIAFIGRIVNLEELSDSENLNTAIAEVKIVQNLYGISVNKGDKIKIKYHSRVFLDYPYPGFPADFRISDVILFIFNNKQDMSEGYLYFNSFWNNPSNSDLKIDLAYYVFDDPNERYSEERTEHAFSSIYMPGAKSRLKLKQFFKLVEKRKAEVKGKI